MRSCSALAAISASSLAWGAGSRAWGEGETAGE
jgi:hypothetical protein